MPSPLLTNIIASDLIAIVQGAAGNIYDYWESFSRAPWVSTVWRARFGQASSIRWNVSASPSWLRLKSTTTYIRS